MAKEGIITCGGFIILLALIILLSCFSTGFGGLEYCPQAPAFWALAIIGGIVSICGCFIPKYA